MVLKSIIILLPKKHTLKSILSSINISTTSSHIFFRINKNILIYFLKKFTKYKKDNYNKLNNLINN